MIIDTNELLESGMAVSDELSDNKIEMAIETAEFYVVKKRLGDDLYISITEDPSEYDTVLNGGVVEKDGKQIHIAGLKKAMYHLTFAFLLRDNLVVTAFSTVRKTDEYSENASDDKILTVAMQHGEIGLEYLREVTDYLGVDNKDKNLPDGYFSEFL